jgi:hypothetical protein
MDPPPPHFSCDLLPINHFKKNLLSGGKIDSDPTPYPTFSPKIFENVGRQKLYIFKATMVASIGNLEKQMGNFNVAA